MHDDYKEGFGVVDADGLHVKTVSDTRRAAIVNWLYVKTMPGRLITNDFTDEQIETMWNAYCGDALVRPVRLYVQ